MQLRRLELIGFKTFVDRTDLEFHPGITAIVGPNGSGKSNIFDAIRWALGETNARLLRGSRMEDVIFSGSATRKPTGLAQVTLTFDNSAGLLPLEFSEITVGRRVIRGGEGEFAINGTDCRLRDIQMLFLGTGLGGRSYALIGQGEVDAVLRATPVERRHWLEEAAGLARHKRQRVEAERRLERAQAHLDRLSDVVDELARQEAALAAQAEAAAAHRTLTDELRALEMALFADEARRLLGAVRRLSAQLDTEREALAVAQQGVVEAAADAAMAEAVLTETTAAWERGQQALLDGAERIQARAADVQALDAQAEGVRTRLADLEAEAARLAQEHAAAAAHAAALAEALDAALRQREAAAQGLMLAEAACAEAAEAAEGGARRLDEAQAEAAEIGRTLAQTRSDLAALAARADVLTETVEATARQAAALRDTVSRLAQEAESAREAAQTERRAAVETDARAADAGGAVDRCRREAADAAEAAHQAALREQELRTRLCAMEDAAAQFAGFEETTRAVLLAAQQTPGRFPGLRGALGDLLAVPETHRPALVAALGERLHCLVTDARDGLEAIGRFVQAEGAGRVQVLVLDAVPAAGASGDRAEAVPLGAARAAEVVEAAPDLRRAVDVLLADTLVVEDLAAARQAAAAGCRARQATRDGALLAPDGVVVLPGRGIETAPLGRHRVIAALRKQVAAAEAACAQAHARRMEAAAALAAAEAAARQALHERTAAAARLAERTQQVARLEAEIARLVEQEANETQEAHRAEASLQSVRAEMARLEDSARQLALAADAAAQRVAGLADEHRRLVEAQEAAADHLTRQRLTVVRADAAVEAGRGRLADRQRAAADLEARRTALEADRAAAAADLAGVLARRAEASAAYDREAAAQAEVRAEVERLAAERVRLRELLAAQQAAHAAAQEAAHAAEAALHRTELRAAQAQAELGAVAARLQEQYGFTLEEAAARRLEVPREEARRRRDELHAALAALGPVNLRAIEEHAAVAARLSGLRGQTADLREASEALRQAITVINAALRVRFQQTFDAVNREFGRLFARLFEGGSGALELVEDEPGGEPGLEVVAQLPGKRRRPLVALSGGERALVALTLIFAMLRVHPSPFCIFDEVEAALDDANTDRFTELLRDLAQQTQVLIITHNKGTMAAADVLYGVTMPEPGLSSVVSVRLVPAPDGTGPAASASGNGTRGAGSRDRRLRTAESPNGDVPAGEKPVANAVAGDGAVAMDTAAAQVPEPASLPGE